MGLLSFKRGGGIAAAVGTVAALGAIAAPSAMAAPTCGTAAITGLGSSLQGVAQSSLWGSTYNGLCSPTSSVTYTAASSGTGLDAWSARTAGTGHTDDDFIGTDDAPTGSRTTGQIGNLLGAQTASGQTQDAEIIPTAQAAISVIVNLPTGCNLVGSPSALTATNSVLGQAFNGTTTTTFQQLFGANVSGTSCGNTIKRVVRSATSGTTFQFKHYLANHTGGAYTGTADDSPSTWPNGTASNLDNTTATSGGVLATTVASTPGTIGYVAVSDAIAARISGTPASGGSAFWVSVQNNRTGFPTAYGAPILSGRSNCGSVNYGTTPSTTQDTDWSGVVSPGADGTDYPICTLTYDIALDHYGHAPRSRAGNLYSSGDATTVANYLRWVVSTGTGSGQALVDGNNYAALPSAIQTIAAAGAARIGN